MDISALDLGLFLLRAVVAFILVTHSTQKLLGWFSGAGPVASAALFEKLGQRPGKVMVYVAAACEMAAAVSLLLGLLLPLGVAIGVGTMIVAGASLSRLNSTFWNSAGGGEYPFFIALVVACFGFAGPGQLSLDSSLGLLSWADRPMLVGATAVALGVVAAVPPILRARSTTATS